MSAPLIAELLPWTQELLGKVRCRPNTEKDLSDAVQGALYGPCKARGVRVAREHPYEDETTRRRWRFDFALEAAEGLLIVEVKLKGGLSPLAMQLHTYAALEGVAGILVVTTKNTLAKVREMDPPQGKPFAVVNLALTQI